MLRPVPVVMGDTPAAVTAPCDRVRVVNRTHGAPPSFGLAPLIADPMRMLRGCRCPLDGEFDEHARSHFIRSAIQTEQQLQLVTRHIIT